MATQLSPREIKQRKGSGSPLVMVTAYDFPTARLAEEAGVDVLLIGDSLGNVVLGHSTTLPVTLDDMIRAGAAVARGAPNTLRVVDLPFLTYVSPEDAVVSAGRLFVEAGAHAVKLEGGVSVVRQVEALTRCGLPVMGHVGYTPQSERALGRRAQGRGSDGAQAMLADAKALVEAGVFAIVLELIPAELAAQITSEVPVPTIGIGAGSGCDGQVQVMHDVLGLTVGRRPRHAGQYADLANEIRNALRAYALDVRKGAFPTEQHAIHDSPAKP